MGDFDFSSGAICLDFSNTWENRSDPNADKLSAYEDLLEWVAQGGLVDVEEKNRFFRLAGRQPRSAEREFKRARVLRETLFRIFSAAAGGRTPDESDIDGFNRALAKVPRRILGLGGECCCWEWPREVPGLDQVVWPVILSAADLMTSKDISRVRECAAPDCSWLFFDTSRGGRRKWCDMGTCGNRAKARRYYERHRT